MRSANVHDRKFRGNFSSHASITYAKLFVYSFKMYYNTFYNK